MSVVGSLSLDTNVLVYCYDHNEPVKGPKAQTLLQQVFTAGQPLVSVQVLSEFYWVVTRRIPMRLSHGQAVAEIQRLSTLTRVVPLTSQTLEKALELAGTHGVSLWDAHVLAVSLLNGATRVLSEDGQHRQCIEGVTILNPFAADFDVSEILVP